MSLGRRVIRRASIPAPMAPDETSTTFLPELRSQEISFTSAFIHFECGRPLLWTSTRLPTLITIGSAFARRLQIFSFRFFISVFHKIGEIYRNNSGGTIVYSAG